MNVAVRDGMVPIAGGQTFLQSLATLGLKSFEMEVQFDGSIPSFTVEDGTAPYMSGSPQDAQHLKERLDKAGATVCAVLLNTDFSGPEADAHIEYAIKGIRLAQALGVTAARIDPATRNSEAGLETVRDNFIHCIKPVLEATAESGVELGIENHGTIGNDPRFLDAVFQSVGDPRLGMTLDCGNFYWSGLSLTKLYETLEHFAPYAKHTHMKSIGYPAEMRDVQRETGYEYGQYCIAIDQGDIDMRRVVDMLRNAGYQRGLCIENESLGRYEFEERIAILQREAALLNALIA